MNRARKGRQRTGQGGFSSVELVISVIIIGLLVAVAFPILTRRAHEARIRTSLSDLENLANAEERVAIDTGGYMVRLFALDDTDQWDPNGKHIAVPNDPADRVDSLFDSSNPQYYKITVGAQGAPENLFIDRMTQYFTLPETARALWVRLAGNESNYAGVGPVWNGPYMSFVRDENVPNIALQPGQTAFDDIPNDPWGNNYLLFTNQGIVDEPEGEFRTDITAEETQQPDTLSQGGKVYRAKLFDRPTILSMGPDGVPGSPSITDSTFGQGDDLCRQW